MNLEYDAHVPVNPVKSRLRKVAPAEPDIVSEPAETFKDIAFASVDALILIVLVPVLPEYVALNIGVPE